jgi:hypothetical protein
MAWFTIEFQEDVNPKSRERNLRQNLVQPCHCNLSRVVVVVLFTVVGGQRNNAALQCAARQTAALLYVKSVLNVRCSRKN